MPFTGVLWLQKLSGTGNCTNPWGEQLTQTCKMKIALKTESNLRKKILPNIAILQCTKNIQREKWNNLLFWRTCLLFPFFLCVKQRRRSLPSPSRNHYKDDYFEIRNKLKGKQINWVNTVSEVSVERRQIRHPRNKDRSSCSRTGRYRTRTHCYGGFNQLMTLIRSDDALRHTRHLPIVWQHTEGWRFWLQRQRMWQQRQMCDFVQTSTSDSQASFHRNTCLESSTMSSSGEWHFFTSNRSHIRRSLRSGREQEQPREAHRNMQ